MSDSWRPHGLQHSRLPCPSLSPRVCSDSLPLSRRSHPTISSPVDPFSSCPQSWSFSSESALCIRWPKYWRCSISPSNEYSGLISFRIDWFDLPAVQGTLKSLLQHHSSKTFIPSEWKIKNLMCLVGLSMLGFLVHHQLPKLAQTHVHRVSDAIQTSHPLSSPYLPAFNLSHHQCLSQWVNSLHQVAKVLELQHQSFQWIFRTDFL